MDEGGLLAGSYKICEARLGNRRLSVGAPLLRNMDGRFFLRAFILEELLLGLLEIRKCPADEHFSPYRPHWRT